MEVFEYSDYKRFLDDWLTAQPRGGHGLKSKLATSLKCRLAYVSRVLHGDANLSAEQALRAARFIGLARVETKYFRVMADRARSETAELKDVLDAELREIRKLAGSTRERLGLEDALDAVAESEYYASWQVSAVHLALTIPELDTREALSKSLKLPIERIGEILSCLIRCRVVAETSGGRLRVLRQLLHGDPRSPSARRHLANWRLKALDEVQFYEASHLHYSATVSLSAKDFDNVREILASALEKMANVVQASPEEQVAAINIDWFNVVVR